LTEQESTDARWLDLAARYASSVIGTPGVSPLAAALITDPESRTLLSRATTPAFDLVGAERIAIDEIGDAAAGTTLYLTLEPLAVDGIIESGIGRVVVGALDPLEPGQGLARLAAEGIEASFVGSRACRLLNEGYAARVTRNRPFVTLKLTLSADDKVGHNAGGPPTMLGPEALRFVERERAAADAELSGAARAEIEANDLRVHLRGLEQRPTLRVVLAGTRDLNLHRGDSGGRREASILVVTVPERPLQPIEGVEIVEIESRNGRPELRLVLALLAERGIDRLFVEAGARLTEAFLGGELVDRLLLIDSPQEIGGLGTPATALGHFADRIAAARFSEVDRRQLGEDKVRTLERV
jgi:diaminohydroxyphosphoribosylaminopyrimidine deaminase/5-amino-6-(5-phosphoribosylamino)uracil reductase